MRLATGGQRATAPSAEPRGDWRRGVLATISSTQDLLVIVAHSFEGGFSVSK
jgi:hypothetical protein